MSVGVVRQESGHSSSVYCVSVGVVRQESGHSSSVFCVSVGVVRQESGHSFHDRLIDLVSESGHMRTDDSVSDTTVN